MADHRGGETKAFQGERGDLSGGSSWSSRVMRFSLSAGLALSSIGCAAQLRYSTEALHAMAPNAGIVDVCMKLPMVTEDYGVVAAYDEDTRTVVTDRDWKKFTAFAAKEAEFIYRYEPSLPDETTELFPEPYKKLSCRAEPSSKEVPVPVDLQPIRMTPVMRDAMVALRELECARGDFHPVELNTLAVIC